MKEKSDRNYLGSKYKEVTLKETNTREISQDIMNKFKNIKKLFEVDNPREDEPYYSMVLECPKEFKERYYKYNNSSIFSKILKNNGKKYEINTQSIIKEESDENSFLADNKENNIEEDFPESITESLGSIEELKKLALMTNEQKEQFLRRTIQGPSDSKKIKESEQKEFKNYKKLLESYRYDYDDIEEEEISRRYALSITYLNFISDLFKKVNLLLDGLVFQLKKRMQEKSTNYLKNKNPVYYRKCLEYLNKSQFASENYFEIIYDDVLLLICNVIFHFTGLNTKLEFGLESNKIFLIIYSDEKVFERLASTLEYELQLKPYSLKYQLIQNDYMLKLKVRQTVMGQDFKNEYRKALSNFGFDGQDENNERNTLMPKSLGNADILNDYGNIIYTPIQFESLEEDLPYNFPPYHDYSIEKEVKFRRYEKNDLYHECKNIPLDIEKNCEECTKFRNIDKLRLITESVERLLSTGFLRKQEILKMIIYQRNYKSYGDIISMSNILKKSWNFFSTEKSNYTINLERNFLGEGISYYFLWIHNYLKWLLFPSIFGFIIFLLLTILPKKIEPKRLGQTPITYRDILMLLYCIIISFWVMIFNRAWKQREKLYAYFWGMEDYISNQKDKEGFIPDQEKVFAFGETLKFVSSGKRACKKFVSYLVLIIMASATCTITFGLLYWKQSYLNFDTNLEGNIFKRDKKYWNNVLKSVLFAAVNAIQIKIFNALYTFLAKKLNEWENYQKEHEALKDLTIKLFIFEFVNAYAGCYFIGFFKPALKKKCVGTCIDEIEMYLYTIFGIDFLLYWIELLLPLIFYKFRKMKFKEEIKKDLIEKNNLAEEHSSEEEIDKKVEELAELQTQSTADLCLKDEAEKMVLEYNEILILYGYVCLFSVTAPLTPFLVLILVWSQRLVDTIKLFFLERIENVNGGNSIGIYNYLMKGMMFVGMLTNVSVVLFSKEENLDKDYRYKIIILLGIENLIIVFFYLINFNNLPLWFSYLSDLKELYLLKFYDRETSKLPHNKFLKQSSYNRYKNDIQDDLIESQ